MSSIKIRNAEQACKPMADYIPTSPGVYLHKNKTGDVIYVGKARNLRKRVAQYTTARAQDPKTRLLVENIASTDFIVTHNELEALLLENQLIKKYKPQYNILLKDAQKYVYIQITNEKFPRVLVSRKTNKRDTFFGPYVKSMSDIVRMARELFGLRACGKLVPTKPCFYYQIKQCSGPCAGVITQEKYARNVADLIHFIKHGDTHLQDEYQKKMKEAAALHNFEEALKYKRRIKLLDRLVTRQSVDTFGTYDQDIIGIASNKKKSAICVLKLKKGTILHKQEFLFLASDDLLDEFLKAYYSKNHAPREIIVPSSFDVSLEEYFKNLWHHTVEITIPQRGLKKDLLDLAIKNAYSQFAIEDPILIGLQQMLKLDVMPMTIDAIDISNYGESVIVGACVQFKNKEPYKAAWRTYTIRGDFGQDDFRSIHEVITRRYERMPLPDLLIIDGGALQLKFALKALEELGHDCSVVGLAKREETIVFADGTTLRLDQKQAASKLILRIRDAVHSFGLKQSRKQFSKAYKHSELDEIPGIGAITKFKLLSQFGSLDAIKKASYDELSTIIGIRAQGVFDFFHKK